ncbi:hypothetical protein ABZ766_37175 [Streptomyces sp. NPDC006670]|uniref:hypothetical protein n=1 Tax=Streptomyces sp. NPDC006670 TaxID=3154476 RepID=UPI003405E15F
MTVDAVTGKYPVTITSQAANSDIIPVNVTLRSGEETSTPPASASTSTTWAGGQIMFASPTGQAFNKGVLCEGTSLLGSRTRVTKITGKMTDPTPGISKMGDYTVSRPGL